MDFFMTSIQFTRDWFLKKSLVLMILLIGNILSAQCSWSNLSYDDFEYASSIPTPGFVPGICYSGQAHPDIYASHSPSKSVYINFIDSNSTTQPGVSAGTLFFSRTFTVCPNTSYKVSSWFCTTFAGLQCNLRIRLKDGSGAILNAVNNFPCAYAPTFSQYSSGVVTPTTTTMVLELITNVGGGGGNDLGMDDLLVEQCLNSAGSVTTQTTVCSASPAFNLFGLLGASQPVYGSWAGPSNLGGGYQGTFQPPLNQPGNYVYSYNYQNISSCPLLRDTVKVTVIPSPSIAVGAATICAGTQAATLTASGAANYTWSPISGLNTVNGSSVSASPPATTVYTITGNFGSCYSTQTTTVTVIPTPVITINSGTVCQGNTIVLTASGASFYTWFPATALGSATGPTVAASPQTTTVYTVTGSSSGCGASSTTTVYVHPQASAGISASTATINAANPVSILTALGGNTFHWIDQANQSNSLLVSPQKSSTYCVEVSQDGLCPDTACITIFVDTRSELSFPNVFTPNGDGENDRFYFPNSNLREFHVSIYNRWGAKVFESSDPEEVRGWDGKINGTDASAGVYSYILYAKGLDDLVYEKAGYLTLFR